MKNELTCEYANKLLRYNSDDGYLYWKANGRFATTRCGKNYYVRIGGQSYRAVDVVWLLNTGEWPEGRVKFINGDCMSMHFWNLRVETESMPATKPATKTGRTKKPPLTYEDLKPKQLPEKLYNILINIPGIKAPFDLLESDRPDAVDFANEKAKALMHALATCPPALIQHRLGYLRAYLKRVDEKPNSRAVQKLFNRRFAMLCEKPTKKYLDLFY